MDDRNFIECKNLCFEYDDSEKDSGFVVLDNVNLSVKKGEMLAILGHNGSGKSTLAKLLNGLILPKSGSVTVDGLCTENEDDIWTIRSKVGMVFQNPDNQLIASVVEDELAFGPENLGLPSEEIEKNIEFALKSVDMEKYRYSTPSALSGGQKQRIAIAGVLAMRPKCIIFDESTAMLDSIGRKEVMNTAKKLNREEGITVIYITHDMEEALMAERIVVMCSGKVALEGNPKEVFMQVDKIRDLGLTLPPATELAYRLSHKGIDVAKDVLSVDELVDSLSKFDFKGFDEEDTNYVNGSDVVLSVKNLSHVYDKGLNTEFCVPDNISFDVHRGEFIAVMGHTGSGKSTLIQHLNALMQPSKGEILFNGKNIFEDKKLLKSIRQKIGLVFQYPEYQLFEMTVFDDVSFGPKNMLLSEDEIKERVEHSLSLVGIGEEYYENSPFELSGGQKRRVAIAGVLAMSPEILVLDEPMAGLDPKGREEILSVLEKLNKEENMTIILISHSSEDVAMFADRVLVMSEGKKLFCDTVKNVFKNRDVLKKAGITVPNISEVFRRLNSEKNAGLPEEVFTVDEAERVLLKGIV